MDSALCKQGPQDCVRVMKEAYRERRDAALQVLVDRGRPARYSPGGAFYLPVDISASGVMMMMMKLISI